jgi:hypothetical protein
MRGNEATSAAMASCFAISTLWTSISVILRRIQLRLINMIAFGVGEEHEVAADRNDYRNAQDGRRLCKFA